ISSPTSSSASALVASTEGREAPDTTKTNNSDEQASLVRALAAMPLAELSTHQCRRRAMEDSEASDHAPTTKPDGRANARLLRHRPTPPREDTRERPAVAATSNLNVSNMAHCDRAGTQRGQQVSQVLSAMPRSVQQAATPLQEDMREKFRRLSRRLDEVFFGSFTAPAENGRSSRCFGFASPCSSRPPEAPRAAHAFPLKVFGMQPRITFQLQFGSIY
uniref:Uncharacterized protein n=1 Tax=Glossina palpalis gambiensis TaxID=67801 RepID=A0A1B0C2S0_9MUSC